MFPHKKDPNLKLILIDFDEWIWPVTEVFENKLATT